MGTAFDIAHWELVPYMWALDLGIDEMKPALCLGNKVFDVTIDFRCECWGVWNRGFPFAWRRRWVPWLIRPCREHAAELARW